MAHSNERIEFLHESRHFYKQEVPPFTQRGNVGYKKEVMILPPYVDKPRKSTVVYVRYKLRGGDRTFACLRMNRQRYIVKAMKRTWQPGDPIENTGGSYYWYQWQGPNAHKQFIGPIAMSMSKYVALNPHASNSIRSATSKNEDTRGQHYQKSHLDPSKLGPNHDGGVIERDLESTFLSDSASPKTSPDLSLAQRGTPTVEHSPASDLPHPRVLASKPGIKTGSWMKRVSTSNSQKRDPLLEGSARILSLAQEQSTILHIELLQDGTTPVKMKLSSAAVPKDEPEKRVTHVSFFDLVTKVVNPMSQPHLIQAAIYPPLSQIDSDQASNNRPNVRYNISISYHLEETFDEFLDKVKGCFEEHHLNHGGEKSFECHVAIKPTVLLP